MDRVAVFVDAGYLFAQGSILVSGGQKLRRGEVRLDETAALDFLRRLAQAITNLPLLRIYWYDGTNAGPSATHTSLAYRPDVKVRLGLVNAFGEQKGVDSLIVTDLINLSRNRAMADALLLTGDEDIRVGVQQAQELGVRVHLVGIANAQQNQSNLLRQEADTLHEISKNELDTFLARTPPTPAVLVIPAAPATAAASSTSTPAVTLEVVAATYATSLLKPDVERVVNAGGSVPPDLDRQLLQAGSNVKNGSLTEQEKRDMRKAFIDACKARP
ncbi:MAG TPA: NYN domain-containing protein [Kofleriaceae bacterium]|nr:NYN domain-containing protein [Kofleriaceae bacterium]